MKRARPSTTATISDEFKKILKQTADLLDDLVAGKYVNPAAAHAQSLTLRRIIDPPRLRTASEELEMMVAISYAIRKELLGPKRGNSKRARAETAKVFKVTDSTVSTFSSRWKNDMGVTIEKIIAGNAKHHGRDRIATLRNYLGEFESLSGQNARRRKIKRNRARVV